MITDEPVSVVNTGRIELPVQLVVIYELPAIPRTDTRSICQTLRISRGLAISVRSGINSGIDPVETPPDHPIIIR